MDTIQTKSTSAMESPKGEHIFCYATKHSSKIR